MTKAPIGVAAAATLSMMCGCGANEPGTVTDLEIPPLQEGYTRFITPKVHVEPGQDITYCQWVAAPSDRDITVRGFSAGQSLHGHHIVLYANTAAAPVGTSRECTNADMLSVRFVGATGGEGNSLSFTLPEGVVYRIPRGNALMANIHFINTETKPIEGQGYIDVQLDDPKPGEQIAGMFTNVNGSFSIPAGAQGSSDMSCTVQEEMHFISFTNHMHEWGLSAYSEIIRSDGSKEMLVADPVWVEEYVFDPHFVQWPIDNLKVVMPGDTIHTHCEWMNDTSSELTFPREMCVGIAFYLPGGVEINCVDGVWEQ